MKNLFRFLLIIGFIFMASLIIIGYVWKWYWTGFPTKTLWDWLSVLAIPAAVGFGTIWITTKQAQESEAENTDNQKEAALQAYIDKMSELILTNNLQSSHRNGIRDIARVRTLTVLRRLDPKRKGSVLQFLQESKLIDKSKPIIDLRDADLSHADLSLLNLRNSNLNNVNLSHANMFLTDLTQASLEYSNLENADLDSACLVKASLYGIHLDSANLSNADLRDADGVNEEHLFRAKPLRGTRFPDGRQLRYPPKQFTFLFFKWGTEPITLRSRKWWRWKI